MSSSASFSWNTARLARVRSQFGKGMLRLGAAVASQARSNAPVKTGNLTRSIRTDATKENLVFVVAGGNAGGFSVPYARRREFENNLHPDTKYYMHRAFDTVVRRGNIAQYFKEVTK